MARTPIHAAGGIVFRGRKRPLVAIVQRAKDERWVLPRGKLKRKEDPLIGARREAVEETGHKVEVHEFLGAITYRTSGRPKVVQFWLMRAGERPKRDVMADILRVEWLPLKAAVRRLSFVLERLFLANVGRAALRRRARRRAAQRKKDSRGAAAPQDRAPRNGTPQNCARQVTGQAGPGSAPQTRAPAPGALNGRHCRNPAQSLAKINDTCRRGAAFPTPHSPVVHGKFGNFLLLSDVISNAHGLRQMQEPPQPVVE